MRHYRHGPHTISDLKVHIVWVPKYRKSVLIGDVAVHTRDLLSKIVQWLKGISSRVLFQEFPHLRKKFWGCHLWARGYLAVSSGNITDEMIKKYIDDQEGEQVAVVKTSKKKYLVSKSLYGSIILSLIVKLEEK